MAITVGGACSRSGSGSAPRQQPAPPAVQFVAPQPLALPSATSSPIEALTEADFDGDGRADLAVAAAGRVEVVRRATATDLQPLALLEPGGEVVRLRAPDLDRDGDPELVALTRAPAAVHVYRNDAGVLALVQSLPLPPDPVALALGDIGGRAWAGRRHGLTDWLLDVLVAHRDRAALTVRFGRGDATFVDAPDFPLRGGAVPARPVDLTYRDSGFYFDDLVVADAANNQLEVHGWLLPDHVRVHPLGEEPTALSVADIDQDGHEDVLVSLAGPGAGGVVALRFVDYATSPLVPVATVRMIDGEPAARARLGDVTGDRLPDLLVPWATRPGLALRRGLPGGGYDVPVEMVAPAPIEALAVGDWVGGAEADLVMVAGGALSAFGGGPAGLVVNYAQRVAHPEPTVLAVADLNADGRDELIVAGPVSSRLVVTHLAPGLAGQAPSLAEIDVGGAVRHCAVTDLDGDQRVDMIATTERGIAVVRNEQVGGSAFSPDDWRVTQVPLSVKDPVHTAFGELTGDEGIDLALCDPVAGTLTLLRAADRQIRYQSQPLFVGPGPTGSVIADFDGDGWGDVAVALSRSAFVTIVGGDGSGGLVVDRLLVPTPPAPTAILGTDLDGDGRLDLVVSHPASGEVTVLRNRSRPGVLQFDAEPMSVDGTPHALNAADINRDGAMDLIVGLAAEPRAWLGLGRGAAAPQPQSVLGTPTSGVIGVGDFDGDRIPDLAVAVRGRPRVAWLRSAPLAVSASAAR